MDAYPFYINKLSVSVDYDVFNKKYDIYKIHSDDNMYAPNVYDLDCPSFYGKILSSVYVQQGDAYLLLRRDICNDEILNAALDKNTVIQRMNPRLIPLSFVFQLLLNALGSYDDELKGSNLTGRFFCFRPSWVHANVIKSLEINVLGDLTFELCVRTFTTVEEAKKRGLFTKERPLSGYKQYCLSNNMTLRRKGKNEECNAYIMRQPRIGKKSQIRFFNNYKLTEFRKSKVGVLRDVIALFRKTYGDVCRFSLCSVNEYENLSPKRKDFNNLDSRVADILSCSRTVVVNFLDDKSDDVMYRVGSVLSSLYGIQCEYSSSIVPGCFNLVLEHDKNYYQNSNASDPYHEFASLTPIQHISFESVSEYLSEEPKSTDPLLPLIRNVVYNVIVKDDVLKGKLSLFDWCSLGYREPVVFLSFHRVKNCPEDNQAKGIFSDIAWNYHVFSMVILPDGSFSIKEVYSEEDLPAGVDLRTLKSVFGFSSSDIASSVDGERKGLFKNRAVCAVVFPGAEVNFIRETGFYTVPGIDELSSYIQELDRIGRDYLSRSNDVMHKIYSGSLDIKGFSYDDKYFYTVGKPAYGVDNKGLYATHLREVEPLNGCRVHLCEILPFLRTCFVRNGQLSVYPFMQKYVNEYIRYYGILSLDGEFCKDPFEGQKEEKQSNSEKSDSEVEADEDLLDDPEEMQGIVSGLEDGEYILQGSSASSPGSLCASNS